MTASLLASAKANLNELGAAPGITVTRFHGIDDADWEDPAVVAAESALIGSYPDGRFDTYAADEMLARMGYVRVSQWANSYPPNYAGPRGQWVAEVETPGDPS